MLVCVFMGTSLLIQAILVCLLCVLVESCSNCWSISELQKGPCRESSQRLPTLAAFKVFSPSFDKTKTTKETLDKYVARLADYTGCDRGRLSQDLDELLVEVAQARAEGLRTTRDIWSNILTTYRKEDKNPMILTAVYPWFALQAQNGTLERKFASKRMQEDRCKGPFKAEGLNERLLCQVSGPDTVHWNSSLPRATNSTTLTFLWKLPML